MRRKSPTIPTRAKRFFPAVVLMSSAVLTLIGATAAGEPTFSKDVLPILQKHCQECHRPEQIAPMSLLNYAQVRPWAKAMRKSVADRTMPPYSVNAPLGHFKDDLRLTEDEVNTVTRWVDAGAPEGNPADAPPPLDWASKEWWMGKPDMVLEFPEFTSKPNGKDEELLLFSDHVFPQNTWVQAFEFKSSDYTVVHHAGLNSADDKLFVPEDLILDSDDPHLDKFGGSSNGGLPLFVQTRLYTWLPGQHLEERPKGEGVRIPKGNRIVIQTHIAPTTEAKPIKISLGIRFVNGPLLLNGGIRVSDMKFLKVPPAAPSYVERERRKFGSDATVTAFAVHMHLRGKSSQIIFHYPDGRSETVLDVPRFDFNWQRIYYLAKPMQVPKGTEIEYIAEWDNSPENPLNPDPTAEVIWGGRTTDEMYGGNVYFSVERLHPLQVENGLVVGTATTE